MSKDSQFRRRMSINKFNNRPPFNLKKIDGSTSTGDRGKRITGTQKDYCDSQDLNGAAKTHGGAGKYLEKIEDPYRKSMRNKNKNVIPKIIESFQRVSPKKRPRAIKSRQKSDSLHTLYRKNDTSFGKNIPNHKLMKKLLRDFDNEDIEINDEGSYENVDVIPSRDTNRSLITNLTEVNLIGRVDKMTSTTGLPWPIISESKDNFQVDLKPSRMNISNKNIDRTKTRIPQKKISVERVDSVMKSNKFVNNRDNLRNYTGSKKSLCSYELEYFPTKEVPLQAKKADCASKIPTKQNVHIVPGLNKLNLNKEFPKYKFNSEQNDINDEQSYMLIHDKNRKKDEKVDRKKKEKSFVRLQVERYNKINKKHINIKSHLPINDKKNVQEPKKNINKNYMNIMSTMRESLPQMGGELVDDSRDGSQQWSDHTIDIDGDVRFPKETRNAMEHMMKNMTRIPLAKCIKNQNLQLHPAISINSQYKAEFEECSKTFSGTSYKKIQQLPCPKNVLCDRGYHARTYTRLDKCNAPPRYNNHRIRPNHKA